jgi:hypothetical protein
MTCMVLNTQSTMAPESRRRTEVIPRLVADGEICSITITYETLDTEGRASQDQDFDTYKVERLSARKTHSPARNTRRP